VITPGRRFCGETRAGKLSPYTCDAVEEIKDYSAALSRRHGCDGSGRMAAIWSHSFTPGSASLEQVPGEASNCAIGDGPAGRNDRRASSWGAPWPRPSCGVAVAAYAHTSSRFRGIHQ
jgi:hypothetical protein